MIRLKKQTKMIIGLLIVFLSLVIAAQNSGVITKLRGKKKSTKISTKITDKLFEEAENKTKIKMDYSVSDIQSTHTKLNEIFKKFDLQPMYSKGQGSYHTILIAFPQQITNDLFSLLRKINGLSNENMFHNGQQSEFFDIDAHLKNNRIFQERAQQELRKTTLSENQRQRIMTNIEKFQIKIDSLKSVQIKHEFNEKNDLAYIRILSNNSGLSYKDSAIRFIISFAISFFIIIIFSVIIFYSIELVDFIMKFLGIKTAKSSDGGNYSYYNNKYSRNDRKKRVYKDHNKGE